MKTKRDEADGLLLEFEEVPQGEADGCRGGIIFKGGFCPYWGGGYAMGKERHSLMVV